MRLLRFPITTTTMAHSNKWAVAELRGEKSVH